MTRWYTSLPRNDRWRARLDTSRLNGFEQAMAALRRQSAPSSPQYYSCQKHSCSGSITDAHTFVRMLAPREKPRPYKGRFGYFSLSHFTV